MKQFSPNLFLKHRPASRWGAWIGAACLSACLGLGASPARASVPPHRAAAAPAKTPTPEITVLFTERAERHSVLGRCDAEGTCKAFLGAFGQGWLPYADPGFKGDDLAAVSSPDGSQLALLSTRGGAANLWLLDGDGRQAQPLTQDDRGILDKGVSYRDCMAFSPDSSHLAYVVRGDVWVADLKTLNAHTLLVDGGARGLAWSPDGSALAVVRYDSIHYVSLDGSSDEVLVAQGCESPDLLWNGNDSVGFLDQGLRSVDLNQSVSMVLASGVEPNSLAALAGGRAALLDWAGQEQTPEVVLTGAPSAPAPAFGAAKPAGASFTQVTQGGAQDVWAAPDGSSLFFLRDGLLWRCGLDGGDAKPLGAVPMADPSVGRLLPLPWACR